MSARELTWVVWALIGSGVTAVVLISVVPGSGVPTLGSVISRWKVHWAGRVAMIVAWMWLGWHLFAR